MNKYVGILEGLLFVIGDEGLTLDQIKDMLNISEEDCKEVVRLLRDKYKNEDSGIQLVFLGNSFKLSTKREHKDYYQKLVENPTTNTLSQAALETLAIIAYNEPITVQEIENIRGVSSRDIVKRLAAKGFLKEEGKREGLVRATTYVTTSDFLDYFGLSSKDELPKFEEIVEKNDEVGLYDSKYKEDVSNGEL